MHVSGTQFITDTIDGIIKSVPNVMYRDRYLYLCLVTRTFCSNTCEGGKMGKGAIYACTSLLIAGTSNPEILSSVTVTFLNYSRHQCTLYAYRLHIFEHFQKISSDSDYDDDVDSK